MELYVKRLDHNQKHIHTALKIINMSSKKHLNIAQSINGKK